MRRTRRDARGQTIVEVALILPIFILLIVGVFDFGRAIYAYNTVLNASREGARQAIVDQTLEHIQERAAEQATALGIDPATVEVDYRSFGSDVPGSCDGEVGTPDVVGCTAVVRVEYDYEAVTPLIGQLVGELTVAGETRFPVEYACPQPGATDCPLGE